MGYETNLYISSDLDAKQTSDLFQSGFGVETTPSLIDRDRSHLAAAFRWQGCSAYAHTVSELSQVYIKSRLGITPTTDITFRPSKTDDIDRIDREILEAINRLMEQTVWDIAYALEGSFILLLRKSGDLILRKDYPVWTPQNLQKMRMPYKMEAIPDL
jgi:hypothetical protein